MKEQIAGEPAFPIPETTITPAAAAIRTMQEICRRSLGTMDMPSFYTDRFEPEDIIGHTVVIHSQADDFRSQPSGDSGEKIACGIIRNTMP